MATAQTIDLPTGKEIIGQVPGSPQRLNSLPMSMAVSPDGRYVVTVNAGYGTFESNYMQSLAVMDTQTGKVTDFPDDQTQVGAKQTLYSGLAFSRDGRHVYASMGSTTDPEGTGANDVGNGVVIFGFNDGQLTRERMLKIPLQQLAPGQTTMEVGGVAGDKGVPFPAALAVVGTTGTEKLLVADNLSDDALLMDAETGRIEKRFDLSESYAVPSTYPVDLVVTKDGTRAFVALWNASEVVELDLKRLVIARKLSLLKPRSPIAPGTHPCALTISPDGRTMYVALANRDAVAAVNISAGRFSVKGYFDTRLPGQSYFGAEPEALALSADGSRLYVANAITDAVAVMDTHKLTNGAAKKGLIEPIGFMPTEWMPMSMAFTGDKLYVATAKGKGTGPNNFAQKSSELTKHLSLTRRKDTYIATLLYGSLAVVNASAIEQNLSQWTHEVVESNRMKAAAQKIDFASGKNPIKHVIYIIKENRTYDQLFGDLTQNGKPVGNGDSSLTMYGADITPNQHALALQFGVIDNFYDSGEVSGEGHTWSNAAIGTDYLDKTWQQNYRGDQRTYDYEGMVADGYPIQQKIPDVNEPASGYLWGDLAAHGKSLYHFAEYISSTFCNEKNATINLNPQEGATSGKTAACARKFIKPGEKIPANWGGGVSKWPWNIPLLARNVATKPELVGHFAPDYPDFNLHIPDQIRVAIFLRHFNQWVKERETGHDAMPDFVMLRLPDDHTAGTTPGGPSPKSSVADNDLAIGRAVDAVSHSPYWNDTAFFILEDDAQNGADHVDAHRSMALIISKYAPHGKNDGAFVDSHFYTTVSLVRTMEMILGLPPMNNNDAFTSVMSSEFSGLGNQAAFTANYVNRDNGLIYTANKKNAVGAKESAKMDFTHADRADSSKLNVILWKDAMGDKPVPAQLLMHYKKAPKDDDDD
ncbi:bifunctional YncE family protein/alkaline phosphatase family protein [Edaphobacter acidisoli]|uniref:bifunctional YncE family protein/alkaline phosphatase family protein n=1 Tax=Edaphobacter acidisoli TaxID=2040573 RepID=UPI001E2E8C4A|nr:bifunctional YncE family protein/alkaline phosphatase family protein [Edaphobacter acidisoli]